MTTHHTPTNSPAPVSGRRARLKAATHDVHDRLDKRIAAFHPFLDREHYKSFLLTQYALHRDVEALFAHPAFNKLLPGLAQRSRLALVEQDLRDLAVAVDQVQLPEPAFAKGREVDTGTALGWLYTVEGSNIGAAFLLKAAAGLELDGNFGARHLAPHADGRAAHWRDFIAQLDEATLSAEQEARVDAGAQAAFAAALSHVERYCPVSK